ncbi:unnamed protein product [Camellia sinensis]
MREKVGFVVCFWFLLYGSCLGRFVVERNNLKVTSPDSLKGVYEYAIGNFGVPQYGGTMVGTVVYAKANQKACKSFSDVDLSFKSKPGGLPIFLLADRGVDRKGRSVERPMGRPVVRWPTSNVNAQCFGEVCFNF